MTPFYQIQDKLLSILSENNDLKGIPIIKDDGTVNDKISEALRNVGICIIISPITDIRVLENIRKNSSITSQIVVSVEINPTRNKENLNKDILVIVNYVIKAVLEWTPARIDEDRFELSSDAVSLYSVDLGLIIYDIKLQKNGVIR
jgi:hypothetical protein